MVADIAASRCHGSADPCESDRISEWGRRMASPNPGAAPCVPGRRASRGSRHHVSQSTTTSPTGHSALCSHCGPIHRRNGSALRAACNGGSLSCTVTCHARAASRNMRNEQERTRENRTSHSHTRAPLLEADGSVSCTGLVPSFPLITFLRWALICDSAFGRCSQRCTARGI